MCWVVNAEPWVSWVSADDAKLERKSGVDWTKSHASRKSRGGINENIEIWMIKFEIQIPSDLLDFWGSKSLVL